MVSFVAALLLGAAVTLCGREAVRVARLAAGLGAATGLLVAACVAAVASTVVVFWVGSGLAGLGGEFRRFVLAALAVGVAAQLLWWRAPPQPREPTRSFMAIVTVLVVAQCCDAARLVLLAFLLAGMPGLPSAWGVGMGSLVVIIAACFCGPRWEERLPLAAFRRVMGLVLGAGAIALLMGAGPLS